MNRKFGLAFILFFVFVVLGFLWLKTSEPKIGYVKSIEVLENYDGMRDAKAVVSKSISVWNRKLDSLNAQLGEFNEKLRSTTLTEQQRSELKLLKNKKENEIQQQLYKAEESSKREDEKLTQGALNQINSIISRYAEENGYDLIIGVTLSGNVLYGSEALDLTDEIILHLNETYAGQIE